MLEISCPSSFFENEIITMSHGSGGKDTSRLIKDLFLPYLQSKHINELHDGARVHLPFEEMICSTDSYVIQPIFFPGGDIGKLSVTGTINDLAMCGAQTLFMSCSFIIEEGFSQGSLKKIVESMQKVCTEHNIEIIAADTKVIERTTGSNIFINTTGLGKPLTKQKIYPGKISSGDLIILSGDIGRHGMAVMAAREGLQFSQELISDCHSLFPSVKLLIDQGIEIHCMRDITRGGLATMLVELANASGLSFFIEEEKIPISTSVDSACELLGINPLYVACEGRFLLIIPPEHGHMALSILSKDSFSYDARIIGHVTDQKNGAAIMKNVYGSKRQLFQLSTEQLPRIC